MKAIYDSGWHHPFVAFVAGLALLFVIARRLSFLHAYLVVFLVEILADASVTGAWSSVTSGTPLYTALSVVFIVLGDFRFFFLADRATREDAPLGRVFAWSLPVSLIIPIVTGVMTKVVPAMRDDRVLYLVYELAAGTLVLALERFRFARSGASPERRLFVRRVSRFFAALYYGWAASDAVILAGVELGHLLRIVPNVMYYGGFLPFVFAVAPASMHARTTHEETRR